jgi:hypothetical protein
MNYFAHGRAFIDDPFFLAGTALPDWMNVVDRKNRIRSKRAAIFIDDHDSDVARLAAGIVQHHADDAWFHQTRAFAELSLDFSRRVRLQLPHDEGFRPHFLGHILVEILLDDVLIAADANRLEAYYHAFDTLDTHAVAVAVERIAPRPAPELSRFIGLFSRERFLWDYADDGKLMLRLNQVMRRVGLPALPAAFSDALPEMRLAVAARQFELLDTPSQVLSHGDH